LINLQNICNLYETTTTPYKIDFTDIQNLNKQLNLQMLKRFIYILVLLALCTISHAQSSIKDRLFTGGNMGLSLGTYTSFMVSPMLGLKISDQLYTGVGIEYNYIKDKRYIPALTYNQYAARIFSQYNFLPQFFTHVELNGASLERYNLDLSKSRKFVPFLFVGGGYRRAISENSFFSLRILFDVLQHKYSPYKAWEPILSIGFGVSI